MAFGCGGGARCPADGAYQPGSLARRRGPCSGRTSPRRDHRVFRGRAWADRAGQTGMGAHACSCRPGGRGAHPGDQARGSAATALRDIGFGCRAPPAPAARSELSQRRCHAGRIPGRDRACGSFPALGGWHGDGAGPCRWCWSGPLRRSLSARRVGGRNPGARCSAGLGWEDASIGAAGAGPRAHLDQHGGGAPAWGRSGRLVQPRRLSLSPQGAGKPRPFRLGGPPSPLACRPQTRCVQFAADATAEAMGQPESRDGAPGDGPTIRVHETTSQANQRSSPA